MIYQRPLNFLITGKSISNHRMIRFIVKVTTCAHKISVEKLDDTHLSIHVTDAPEKGKANKAVLRILADYFDVTLDKVTITAGYTSKNKIITVA